MALGVQPDAQEEVLATINTTPLVDVMLVLLIIFLITIPVVNTSITVNLPKESNTVRETKPQNVVISINATGDVFWHDSKLKNHADLQARLQRLAKESPQPELQIRGDASAAYAHVGAVVDAAQRAGIAKIGFVTEPQSP